MIFLFYLLSAIMTISALLVVLQCIEFCIRMLLRPLPMPALLQDKRFG